MLTSAYVFPSLLSFCLPSDNTHLTNPVNFPSFHCMQDIPPLLDSLHHFSISHTIGPTDLLQPFPISRSKTCQVFLIYFPKCPIFSPLQTMQDVHVTLTLVLSRQKPIYTYARQIWHYVVKTRSV